MKLGDISDLPKWRRYRSVLLMSVLLSGDLIAEPELNEIPSGRSGLGWAGEDASLDGWFDVNEFLLLKGDERIPIRLNFSSKQLKYAQSALGDGWWFPLLESTVVEEDVNVVVLRHPTGDTRKLWVDAKNLKRYATFDGEWVGLLTDDQRFEVTGPNGWRLFYEGGHLKRAVTPAGERLEWQRRADKVVEIHSDKQGALLSARYGSRGMLEEIKLNQGLKDRIQFTQGQRPILAPVQGENLVVGVQPAVQAIKATKGYSQQMEYDIVEGRYLMNLTRTRYPWQQPKSEQLTWDAITSAILSDGSWNYSSAFKKNTDKYPELVRVNKAGGEKESWYYDSQTGVSERLFTNGVRHIVSTANVAGKSPVRKVVEVKPDGTETLLYRASYDSEGRLVRGMQRNPDGSGLAWIITATPAEVKAALESPEGLEKLFPEQPRE